MLIFFVNRLALLHDNNFIFLLTYKIVLLFGTKKYILLVAEVLVPTYAP